MHDVKTQLRSLLEETPAVTLEEVLAVVTVEADEDLLQPQRVTPRRGFLVAVGTAAAVLLIVAIVGGALLAGRSTKPDPVAPSMTSTLPTDSSVSVEDLVWSSVVADPAEFGDPWFRNVTVVDEYLVATGEDSAGPAAWTSPNGLQWTRVPVDDVPLNGRLETIAVGGPGLIGVAEGLIYTSVEGVEWTEAQCPDCLSGDFSYVADLAAGDLVLVAVGSTHGNAYAWTSLDGLTWTRHPVQDSFEMEGVAAGGPGFVAVGHSANGAEVLTSLDGISWSRFAGDADVFRGSQLRSVVAIGDGLVGLGEWPSGSGRSWTSSDGYDWTPVPESDRVFAGSSIHDAAVFGDRIVAVGDQSIWIAALPGTIGIAPSMLPAESRPPSIWSLDVVWQKTEITEPWARSILDLTALPGGGFAVVASQGGNVLWSRDGVSWQEADPDGVTLLPGWRAAYDERIISALPGRVVVLNRELARDPVVRIGDLSTGEWRAYALDLDGVVDIDEYEVAIASNKREVLVVAKAYLGETWEENDPGYLAWRIDPDAHEVQQGMLPAGFGEPSEAMGGPGLEVEWFGDRWVAAAGDTSATSRDGSTWTMEVDSNRAGVEAHWVTSLTAGSDALIATTCGGWGPHFVWYSEDGLEWTKLPESLPAPHEGYAYSDSLGFVLAEDGRVLMSNDGRTWEWTVGPSWGDDGADIAASGNRLLLRTNSSFLLTYTGDD